MEPGFGGAHPLVANVDKDGAGLRRLTLPVYLGHQGICSKDPAGVGNARPANFPCCSRLRRLGRFMDSLVRYAPWDTQSASP